MDTVGPSVAQTPLFDGSINANPAGLSFAALVAEDFRTHGRDVFAQGFWALFWHRFGNWRMSVPRPFRIPLSLIYRIMFKLTEILCGIHLPYPVRVGRRVRLDHYGMILAPHAIGDDVVLRQNVTIGVADETRLSERPTIGSRVSIGAGAVILGDIYVQDGAMIGANSVVTKDVAANTVVGGVPARVLKNRPDLDRGLAI